jgi:hypothetical protein
VVIGREVSHPSGSSEQAGRWKELYGDILLEAGAKYGFVDCDPRGRGSDERSREVMHQNTRTMINMYSLICLSNK